MPFDLESKVTKLLDNDKGELFSAKAKKGFDLGIRRGMKFSTTPYVKTVFAKNFFGITDSPTNMIYGTTVEAVIGEVILSLNLDVHDGKGDTDNCNVVGLTLTTPL